MSKNAMLESLSIAKDLLEGETLKKVTENQRDVLYNRFNKYLNFEYGEDGGYIFFMSSEGFKSFEYYFGMEYEQEDVEIKIEIDGNVLVVYSYNCERAENLIELLNECEEE